jgi:hypothetical protein
MAKCEAELCGIETVEGIYVPRYGLLCRTCFDILGVLRGHPYWLEMHLQDHIQRYKDYEEEDD